MRPQAQSPLKAFAKQGRQAWGSVWERRNPREQRALRLLALVLGTALGWGVLLAPALKTWHQAPQRQADLDEQTRRMQRLQAEAAQLAASRSGTENGANNRSISRASAQAVKQLEADANRLLGPDAQVQMQGNQLRVTLKAASAQNLAEWLVLARQQAQALPDQTQLERVDDAIWRGTLLLRLP
jgi:general secretion pathway protein M